MSHSVIAVRAASQDCNAAKPSVTLSSYSTPGGMISIGLGWVPGHRRAVISAPRWRSRRPRHTLSCHVPIKTWRTLKTAQASHGSHRSGRVPRSPYSIGGSLIVAMNALTPLA